ncbi:MAG: fumarylacetoacetate hydrolase family protein [Pacificimonas sp.]|jgi:2-keto-4-pentenoate hydratase/2-oxohepta-3-ene-1,7-dioic acid hydratase in catechol pathway|nr:fumarylacetoacetate hydrolase family protein [Pacificimonas sp.]
MKLATYEWRNEGARLGVLKDDLIIDVERLGVVCGNKMPLSMLELIDCGPVALAALSQLIEDADAVMLSQCSTPACNVRFLAPIPRPRKNIIGIGLNYTEHVAESARSLDTSGKLPEKPIIFSKPPTAVTGWDAPVYHNSELTQQLDWETELGVIMGRTARNAAEAEALSYVFGYTIINDISARDCRREGQWIVSKGQDSFAPMGPLIVTADEISDPHDLALSTFVNGVEKQNSNTKYMLFNINALIADISQVMTLEPGDIIATGTPAGVGAGRDPQEFMWPGDVVESVIEPIGRLRNPIVAA